MNESFTPLASLVGGLLIGTAASLLWVLRGRVAGISGIASGALVRSGDRGWRIAFVAGLVVAGLIGAAVAPAAFANSEPRSPAVVIGAGLLVGFGTRLGSGCTSGHGICGLARGRARSLAATLTFMAAGALTVWLWGAS